MKKTKANKELAAQKKRATDFLINKLDVEEKDIKSIEKLGGLSNYNYKVIVGEEEWVTRVPGPGTSETIDRNNEKINSLMAYDIDVNCHTIYFDEKTGYKVTKYIKDAETINPETAKKEENMELIADLLNRLHESNKTFHNDFDPFKDIEFYEKALLDAGGTLYEGYEELKKDFMTLKDELIELGMVLAPCHLDALAENFIRSGDEMFLVDWEFSGNYDKIWDITSLVVECEFSPAEEKLLYQKYFDREPTKDEVSRIEIHKIVQDILWGIWSAAKAALGDEALIDYSKERYERGKQSLANYRAKNK